MRKDIRNFLNGSIYGVTLIVPGVSATIFAIILGFYDELIGAINHFSEDYRKNVRYLAVFMLGIAAGAVVFSSLLLYLLTEFSFPTMLFFMGLLLGIVPFTVSKAKGSVHRLAPQEIVLAVVSFAALIALSQVVNTAGMQPAYGASAMSAALIFYVLIAGLINGATLVIPGLSGAFILLIMGLYPIIIQSVSSVGDFLGDLSNLSLLRDIAVVLLPFGIGAVIGCLVMARLMEKLLRDYHQSVYAVILGLLIGSVVTLIWEPMVYQSGMSTPAIISGVLTLCTGCAASYVLGKKQ